MEMPNYNKGDQSPLNYFIIISCRNVEPVMRSIYPVMNGIKTKNVLRDACTVLNTFIQCSTLTYTSTERFAGLDFLRSPKSSDLSEVMYLVSMSQR